VNGSFKGGTRNTRIAGLSSWWWVAPDFTLFPVEILVPSFHTKNMSKQET